VSFKLLLAALLLAAPAMPDPVGRYRLREGPDVVSELVIRRDGTFQYGLIAGALDENAGGSWRRAGMGILLTTRPKPGPPSFAAGPARHTEETPLRLHVTWPDGRDAVGTDLRIEFESGPPLVTYVGGPDAWSMPAGETRRPVAVTLALGMFGFASPRFAIDVAKANELTFVITPHDLGTVDFEALPLDVEPGVLVMHRGRAAMRYLRVR
jgi:hypothetical protein